MKGTSLRIQRTLAIPYECDIFLFFYIISTKTRWQLIRYVLSVTASHEMRLYTRVVFANACEAASLTLSPKIQLNFR